jgi:hypothetical protein
MAVTALSRTRARAAQQTATLAPGVLVLTLIAPAFDLLSSVQPGLAVLAAFGMLGTAVASAALLLTWLRFPRTSWLAAASLAGFASLAMRLVGADVAPVLSLLSVIGLGLGGAFASPARHDEVQAWLA